MYFNSDGRTAPSVSAQPRAALTSEIDAQHIELGLASRSPYGSTSVSRDMRRMTPVVFNNCFGWLHYGGASPGGSDVAVLICTGLNRDALDAHYPLRLLADEIAAAGYMVLRFDYPGTGDSYDVADTGEGSEGHWTAWQKSVDGAAEWLRNTLGIRRLVFCGIRFGALLATLAVARQAEAVGLLLLAPVLRGQSYMRQMSVQAKLQQNIVAAAGGPLDFQGLYLSSGSIAAISQVDLRQAELPKGLEVGLFPQSASSIVTACEQAWAEMGAHVQCGTFEGMEAILHHNLQGEGQPSDFSSVLRWLAQSIPARPVALPDIVKATSYLAEGAWVETPLRFGEDDHLVGIFCRPRGAVGNDAVLITNSGVDPHYGSCRFGVELARRLAAEGTASLRFDFAGLGDSLGRPGKENVVSGIFESDRRPDIRAAIDALEKLGLDRFAIGGLCSGAYHALQGALYDERLQALFLINMPVFEWKAGETIKFVYHKSVSSASLVKLIDRTVLKQLLRGEIEVRLIAHAQLEGLRERFINVLRPVAKALGLATSNTPAAAAVATLSHRQVKTLFIYSPEDVGFDVFEQNFGRRGSRVPPYEGATVRVIPQLDHILSARDMRNTVCGVMIDWLSAVRRMGDAESTVSTH